MTSVFLNSGLHSVTFWVALVALASALLAWRRGGRAALPGLLTSRGFLLFLAGVNLMTLAFGLYKGYVVPRDLMQDIVSAQEFLAGRSLYPEHMNELMRDALAKEPPRSLLEWSPSLRAKELDAQDN